MDVATDLVPVRNARNRLIDALGLGDCYPLTDLNVVADRLKVPFGGTVRIPVAHAQSGVRYELCDPKGTPLGARFAGDGQDGTLEIETPPVQEDITYRIRASKIRSAAPERPLVVMLEEPAPVKVGLDTTLAIEIGDVWLPDASTPMSAALLDTGAANPKASDPRLVPFGASVEVKVNRSQEAVEYSLNIDGRDLPAVSKTGDLGTIALRSSALVEDSLIRVRATKRFLASENRQPETSLLDAPLSVAVKADPSVQVSPVGGAIVDYGASGTLRIVKSQKTANYRAYVRPIPDRDFVRRPGASVDVTSVAVPGEPTVRVAKPRGDGMSNVQAGSLPIGAAAQTGTGGDLTVSLDSLTEDVMVIVQATKAHSTDPLQADAPVVESAIALHDAAVLLVRPDPQRALSLRVPVAADRIAGDVEVSGGQPGVMYQFRDKTTDAPIPWTAYFHKRDDEDATQNKGIGQLAVEVDMAVPADPVTASSGQPQSDGARQVPRPPLLSVGAGPADVTWLLRAMKAQTRVSVAMVREAVIVPPPTVRAESAIVDAGASTNVLIDASRTGERYQLMIGGVAQGAAVGTDGSPVSLSTGAVGADTVFDVVITRPEDNGIAVARVVSVSIAVRRP